jgi:Uma2 family endonuclease
MALTCAVDDDLQIIVPDEARTHAGFRAWAKSNACPERARVTFFNGEIIIDMSKEELETHAKLKGEIGGVVYNINRAFDLGEYYPDGVLVSNDGAGLTTNPDLTFVLWETLEAKKVILVPRKGVKGQYLELIGSPDLLVEIVSRGSVRKDKQLLRDAYHRARIPEYWLIDARGEEIDFKLFWWRRTGYVAVAPRDGWLRSRILQHEFKLERVRHRLGLWRYTLHARPIRTNR